MKFLGVFSFLLLKSDFAFAQLTIPDFAVRSYDGTDRDDNLGQANSALHRLAPALADNDHLNDPSLANPRTVSNLVGTHPPLWPSNSRRLSDMVWQWGQFIDHDFALTGHASGVAAHIPVPQDDTDDVLVEGNCAHIPFTRTDIDPSAHTREQVNLITAFIDASMVYGSDKERADALRTFSDGKLKVSAGNLLPLNEMGLDNAGGADDSTLFVAGDIRANEQLGLTAMHTLFVREHNRLADRIKNVGYNNDDDETIYQLARKIVASEIQIITYKEFLPAILGSEAPRFEDYNFDAGVNPQLSNEFSTVFFRFGHSMLSENFRLDHGQGQADTFVPLREAFFNPDFFKGDAENIDRIIRGLITTDAQEIDCKIIDDVRSFLFSDDGSSTFCLDLGSLNIQRGRDHQIPKYNAVRAAVGLSEVTSFQGITSDESLQAALQTAYGSVDNVDAWIGALAEDHLQGASVGELLAAGMKQEFERLRDGDPFFHERPDGRSDIPRMSEIIDLGDLTLGYVIEKNVDVNIDSAGSVFFNGRIFDRDPPLDLDPRRGDGPDDRDGGGNSRDGG
ncbi:MAG: hypothetical protein SGILL_005704, partial [Bacillariaceae sp.]